VSEILVSIAVPGRKALSQSAKLKDADARDAGSLTGPEMRVSGYIGKRLSHRFFREVQ
jgi:hypothetical protein